MAQSSREIVHAAVHFGTPDRLPVRMGGLGRNDTAGIPVHTRQLGEGEEATDEWHCRWVHTDLPNMGQDKDHPLADITEHEKVQGPDYSEDWRYEDSDAALTAAEEQGRYTQTGIFMVLFERMHTLAGFENVLMGLLTDRENAGALADRIVDTHLCLVRNCQERMGERLHSFSMTDDWGTQNAAFISMDLWRDFFLPRYKRLFDAMHEGGQDVWVHSCGKVNEIIEGYIEAGVDVVNLQQPRALGIEEIGRRYRGRITFESLSDIQASLPSHNASLIEADATALARHWMMREGGFVFSDYGDARAIGADPDAKMTMYRAFSRVSEDLYGNPLPEPIAESG